MFTARPRNYWLTSPCLHSCCRHCWLCGSRWRFGLNSPLEPHHSPCHTVGDFYTFAVRPLTQRLRLSHLAWFWCLIACRKAWYIQFKIWPLCTSTHKTVGRLCPCLCYSPLPCQSWRYVNFPLRFPTLTGSICGPICDNPVDTSCVQGHRRHLAPRGLCITPKGCKESLSVYAPHCLLYSLYEGDRDTFYRVLHRSPRSTGLKPSSNKVPAVLVMLPDIVKISILFLCEQKVSTRQAMICLTSYGYRQTPHGHSCYQVWRSRRYRQCIAFLVQPKSVEQDVEEGECVRRNVVKLSKAIYGIKRKNEEQLR